jgi:hypothetical protein
MSAEVECGLTTYMCVLRCTESTRNSVLFNTCSSKLCYCETNVISVRIRRSELPGAYEAQVSFHFCQKINYSVDDGSGWD